MLTTKTPVILSTVLISALPEPLHARGADFFSSPNVNGVISITLLILILIISAALCGFLIGSQKYKKKQTSKTQDSAPTVFNPSAHAQELISFVADWSWQTDAQHRFTYISESLKTATGLDPANLIGLSPWQLPGQQTSRSAWNTYFFAIKNNQPIIKNIPLKIPDGRTLHFELIGCPIFHNHTLNGYHGIARDISERITTIRALQETQQRYFEVVESVHEVIFRTDMTGRFTFLNKVWQTLSGYPVSQSLNCKITAFLHPDDQHKAEALLNPQHDENPARGAHNELELRLRTRKGEIRWIRATSKIVTCTDNQIQGMAGTIEDISVRKIAEMTLKNINQDLEERVRQRTTELEASNRELEAFSYSVSHDLRTPLRAIDGFSRLLEEDLDEKLDETSRNHLHRIRSATQRMAYLIDDLISLAHLTRLPLRKEVFDISAMVFQIIDELRAENPHRAVDIKITNGLMVTADRTLIHVMLENLLSNAWKFSSKKAVAQITFSAERKENQRIFCISDNGAGFSMEFADKLFQSFNRLHSNEEFPGTGIGLATVLRIIQRHNGTIWADSAPEKGARFYFTLGN